MEGFCRGCLIRYDDPAKLLPYTEKNRRLFIYCTGIKVRPNEIDTFQLCKDCHVNMKLSCKFKKQCRISDKKFKHYLSLKEVGDAFDLSTFLQTNDESLRFPLLSGSSTPNPGAALGVEKDDDNESTCTSIRNFMTDILDGEEMPDTEAHIIKEVIEEAHTLDDTLDSEWLQDDVSRDTDFKGLSFSPLSNPQSIRLDHCYTPIKQIEANIINENSTTDRNILITSYLYKERIDEVNTEPPKVETLQETTETGNDKSNDQDCLFEEIIGQNVNYVTQNENDIAITNSKYDNIDNETRCAAKAIHNKNEHHPTNQDELAVKYLLESNKENDHVAHNSEKKSKFSTVSTKYIDVNQIQNDRIEISFTLNQGSEVKEYIEEVNIEIVPEQNQNHLLSTCTDQSDSNKKLIHGELSENIMGITLKNTDGHDNNNKDVLEQIKLECDKDYITLDDLLVLPTESTVFAGASTPMINDILFGEKLNVDDDDSNKQKSDKEEDGGDILDEILQQGVKEFSIHSRESQADAVYDMQQLYCKTCDKKFKMLKGLKIHLIKYHGIKLPKTRSRNFDTQNRICNICGDTFNQFKSFQLHMKNHSSPKQGIKCPKCHIEFASEIRLKRHMTSHKSAKEPSLDVPSEKVKNVKYVCTICGKCFLSASNLIIHKRRHAEDYSESCGECGKGFYRKADLETHMRVHTKDKPFQCKICDQKFTTKYTLLKHTKVHLGETPYECDICSKKYVLKTDLMRHINRAKNCIKKRAGLSTKKPIVYKYQCAYCRNKFRQKTEFVKHQKHFKPCATLHGHSSKPCIVIDGTELEQNENLDVEMIEEI